MHTKKRAAIAVARFIFYSILFYFSVLCLLIILSKAAPLIEPSNCLIPSVNCPDCRLPGSAGPTPGLVPMIPERRPPDHRRQVLILALLSFR